MKNSSTATRHAASSAAPLRIRTAHTDYYVPNGRPKKLWLKPLANNACVLLCAPEVPEDCQAGVTEGGGARSPLKTDQLKTLRDAFLQVPDPRRPDRLASGEHRHPAPQPRL